MRSSTVPSSRSNVWWALPIYASHLSCSMLHGLISKQLSIVNCTAFCIGHNDEWHTCEKHMLINHCKSWDNWLDVQVQITTCHGLGSHASIQKCRSYQLWCCGGFTFIWHLPIRVDIVNCLISRYHLRPKLQTKITKNATIKTLDRIEPRTPRHDVMCSVFVNRASCVEDDAASSRGGCFWLVHEAGCSMCDVSRMATYKIRRPLPFSIIGQTPISQSHLRLTSPNAALHWYMAPSFLA